MKMKNMTAIIAALIVLIGCGSGPKADGPDELDAAVREAADYLNTRIPAGNKTAFINISGGFPDLSDYILSDLSKHAVNDGVFSVVDRAQLDAVRAELNFSWSGEVDDSSAQEIGKMLGAQTIVSGSVRKIGALYRLDIRAIAVQTAEVQGQWNKNIPNGATIAALTITTASGTAVAGGTASGGRTSGGSVAGGQTSSGGQAAAPAAALHKNGTYTFYPRPRMMREGRDINCYLEKIVVRGGFFTLYITGVPQGFSRDRPDMGNTAAYSYQALIQNLDRPTSPPVSAKSYDWEYSGITGGPGNYLLIVFNNHNIKRFSLSWDVVGIGAGSPPRILEEIVMPDEPDE